jgi:hypothetical protein
MPKTPAQKAIDLAELAKQVADKENIVDFTEDSLSSPPPAKLISHLDFAAVDWVQGYRHPAHDNNRPIKETTIKNLQEICNAYHNNVVSGSLVPYTPDNPKYRKASDRQTLKQLKTLEQRAYAKTAAQLALPHKKRVKKEAMSEEAKRDSISIITSMTRKRKLELAADANNQKIKKLKQSQLSKIKLPWNEILNLMIKAKWFNLKTKGPKKGQLCIISDDMCTSMETATGYAGSRLREFRTMFSQGQIPDQTKGRHRRIPSFVVDELRAMLSKEAVLDDHFVVLMQKIAFYLAMSIADQKNEELKFATVGKSVMQRVFKEMKTTVRQGQVQTLARHLAGKDWNAFATLVACMDVLRETCGVKHTVPEQEREDGIEEQRVFDRRWIWNMDASAGATFSNSALLRQVLDGPLKAVLDKGIRTSLKQQFNLLHAVNAVGQMMPPVIGIRARTGVDAGAPLIIPLRDSLLNASFHTNNAKDDQGQPVVPLLVVYNKHDKKCLTEIFLAQVVDPILHTDLTELTACGNTPYSLSLFHLVATHDSVSE